MQKATTWPTGRIRVHEVHGVEVIEFRGEFDIATALPIMPELDAATAAVDRTVIVDLTPTQFLDCYGLRLLHRAERRVTERGGRLLLVCPHALILKILHVTGLSGQLAAMATLEEALVASGASETAG
ncbi:STAS domain-containing protein [Streptomyces sp. NPDC048324]|uniref:STAS domain-containing protein n=1 Tax=Streptomyces sp. NPDC048324 TaxID=3157205 RepID=UPI0034339CC1